MKLFLNMKDAMLNFWSSYVSLWICAPLTPTEVLIYPSVFGSPDEINPDQMPHKVVKFWSNNGLVHTSYIQYLKHITLIISTHILFPPHISQDLLLQDRGILLVLQHSHFPHPVFSFEIWLWGQLRFDLASLCLKAEKYRIACKTFRMNRNGFTREVKRW